MTPEQAKMLEELHEAFIGKGKPVPAYRRLFALVDARTWGLADKAGVKPNPKG